MACVTKVFQSVLGWPLPQVAIPWGSFFKSIPCVRDGKEDKRVRGSNCQRFSFTPSPISTPPLPIDSIAPQSAPASWSTDR